MLQATGRCLQPGWARLGVVAAHAELQHLIEAAALGQKAAQAPEGAAAERGAADACELPLPGHLEHAHAAADVDQQVGKQVRVRCARANTPSAIHFTLA